MQTVNIEIRIDCDDDPTVIEVAHDRIKTKIKELHSELRMLITKRDPQIRARTADYCGTVDDLDLREHEEGEACSNPSS